MSDQAAAHSASEKMDGIYRHQRFIYDATRRYYLLGRDRLIADLGVPAGGSVLEVGCGTARNLIKAARRYPSAQAYGLDVSEAMLQTARRSISRRKLEGRIMVAAGDATAFDAAKLFGRAQFDRVFISYALSMIPGWQRVVGQALPCVVPGGTLSIVDFGGFETYPALLRRAQHAWLRRFSVTPIPNFAAEIRSLAEAEGASCAISELYGGYAIQAQIRPGSFAERSGEADTVP